MSQAHLVILQTTKKDKHHSSQIYCIKSHEKCLHWLLPNICCHFVKTPAQHNRCGYHMNENQPDDGKEKTCGFVDAVPLPEIFVGLVCDNILFSICEKYPSLFHKIFWFLLFWHARLNKQFEEGIYRTRQQQRAKSRQPRQGEIISHFSKMLVVRMQNEPCKLDQSFAYRIVLVFGLHAFTLSKYHVWHHHCEQRHDAERAHGEEIRIVEIGTDTNTTILNHMYCQNEAFNPFNVKRGWDESMNPPIDLIFWWFHLVTSKSLPKQVVRIRKFRMEPFHVVGGSDNLPDAEPLNRNESQSDWWCKATLASKRLRRKIFAWVREPCLWKKHHAWKHTVVM